MANQNTGRTLLDVVRRRADRWTTLASVADPDDNADWWHVVWERLGDVAYLQSIEPSAERADWLTAEVGRICALDADAWLGPVFRSREEPSIGTLETAHVGLGISTVLQLCPSLMPVEQVAGALQTHGLEPIERALRLRENGTVDVNNWYHVLLDGYAAMALTLGDAERIATLADRVRVAIDASEPDSYGESVQYWGYAALHLTHLWETATVHGVTVPEVTPSIAACLPWVTQSVMFSNRASHWGPGCYLTMVNFGDSAVTARPPADVLLHLARWADPEAAGLARWLYDIAYADPELAPTDLSTFGFFNQPTWRSVCHLEHAVQPSSPTAVGLPTVQAFSVGTGILRGDDREQTVLAVQGGHGELSVGSHRHADAGSFVLGHAGELIFSDPGHCCYRLPAYRAALPETAHSTWTIRSEAGVPIPQTAQGITGTLTEPVLHNGFWQVSADVAPAYGAPVRTARRTWLFREPHLVLVIDDIVADEPVVVDSRFVVDNRDGRLLVNRATERRTVLRHNAVAAKFFLLEAWSDGAVADWPLESAHSTLHDVYDPHPNAPGQGKEGSGLDLIFHASPARRHQAVYSIVVDEEPKIRSWHVNWADGSVVLGHPGGREETITIPFLG